VRQAFEDLGRNAETQYQRELPSATVDTSVVERVRRKVEGPDARGDLGARDCGVDDEPGGSGGFVGGDEGDGAPGADDVGVGERDMAGGSFPLKRQLIVVWGACVLSEETGHRVLASGG